MSFANENGGSSDHYCGDRPEAEWTSHRADLEDMRQALMWRFAPGNPDEYLKVDRAYHLLVKVLLAQEERRRRPDRM